MSSTTYVLLYINPDDEEFETSVMAVSDSELSLKERAMKHAQRFDTSLDIDWQGECPVLGFIVDSDGDEMSDSFRIERAPVVGTWSE